MKPTVFLGGGRITGALIAGLRLAKYDAPIIVHDRHPQKLRRLQRQYRVQVEADLHRAVERAGLLIVAVRPGSVRELLREIDEVSRPITAVSLAAGVPLSNTPPWIRTASALGEGDAQPRLPERPGIDRRDFQSRDRPNGSAHRQRIVRESRAGAGNPGEQIRRVYRDLFLQSWISCSGHARGRGAIPWPGPENGINRGGPRPGRWNCCLAGRERSPASSFARSGHAGRHRRDRHDSHGRSGTPACGGTRPEGWGGTGAQARKAVKAAPCGSFSNPCAGVFHLERCRGISCFTQFALVFYFSVHERDLWHE